MANTPTAMAATMWTGTPELVALAVAVRPLLKDVVVLSFDASWARRRNTSDSSSCGERGVVATGTAVVVEVVAPIAADAGAMFVTPLLVANGCDDMGVASERFSCANEMGGSAPGCALEVRG